jgi:ribokinase
MAIVVVGSINTDLVVRVDSFPVPGETVYGSDFSTYAGGKGANQAAAAARLGATVSMLGAVGDDSYGSERREDLANAGVNVAPIIVRSEIPSGVALIQVDRSGQNQIVIVPGANGTVSPDEVRHGLTSILRPGDLMLAQLELPLDTVQSSLQFARNLGARSIVNTAPFVEGCEDFLGLIDVLVVNEIEAGQLLGRGPVTIDEAADAAQELRAHGPELVFVTLGAAGAVIQDSSTTTSIPAPEVRVIDTTGAGDATVGAFAMALSEGMETAEAARIAVMTGSFAVQRAGAQASQPTRDELYAFIEERESVR